MRRRGALDGAVHGAVHGTFDADAADHVGTYNAAQRRGAALGLRDWQPTAAGWGCPQWLLCAVAHGKWWLKEQQSSG